jgi:branched-chain amino acid transport system ATP-binding protein
VIAPVDTATPTVAPLLQVQGLVKRFGGLTATDGCDLTVRAGEIHALIGPNGAGKTTLIHQLSGALAPDAGRLWFDGQDITRRPIEARVALGLARSFQITSVFRRLSVQDNLALALQARGPHPLGPWRRARADASRHRQAAELAERIGLAARLPQPAGALSHAEQRQLEVGLALATGARLLLLDEPMAGMGPDETGRLVDLLAALRGQVTLLLVEHDMDAVFRLADTISTLVAGRVVASGPPEVIRAHPEVRRAYLGDDGDEGHAPPALPRTAGARAP